MPSMVVFRRRSLAAGDDMRYLLIPASLFRCVQIVLTIPVMIHVITSSNLRNAWNKHVHFCLERDAADDSFTINHPKAFSNSYQLMIGYMAFSLTVALIGLSFYVWMYVLSQRGTPTNIAPRRLLPRLIEIDMTLLYVIRAGTLVFGGILAYLFTEYYKCVPADIPNRRALGGRAPPDDVLRVFRSTWYACIVGLQTTQLIDTCYGFVIHGLFFCSSLLVKTTSVVSAQSKWQFICRCLIGCLACLKGQCWGWWRDQLRRLLFLPKVESHGTADLRDFAGIFNDLFDTNGKIDVTTTDILAGVYVTRLLHFDLQYALRQHLATDGQSNGEEGDVGSNHLDDIDSNNMFKDYDRAVIHLVEKKFPPSESCSPEDASDSDTRGDGDGDENYEQSHRPSNQRLITLQSALPSEDFHPMSSLQSPIPPTNEVDQKRHGRRGTRAGRFSFGILAEKKENLDFVLQGPLLTKCFPSNTDEKLCIAEGARYIEFATNVYKWSTSDRQPFFHGRYFDHFRRQNRGHERDYTFGQGDHAGYAMTVAPIAGIEEEDIVYASYRQGLLATPFAIILDHEWKSVVVTIRGTLSVDDIIKDMMVTPTELRECGEKYGCDGDHKYAHRGTLGSTEWVYNECLKILEELLLGENAKFKEYRLRIVGHSLGAAIASLLSVFLRSKFPTIRAVVFEPQGCTMSKNLAEEVADFVLSFVTGADLVPRLGYVAVQEMRDTLLLNIARIKVCKYRVVDHCNVDRFGIDAVRDFLEEALYKPDEIPESEFIHQFVKFRNDSRLNRKRQFSPDRMLYIPGKIIGLQALPGHKTTKRKSSPIMVRQFLRTCCFQDIVRDVISIILGGDRRGGELGARAGAELPQDPCVAFWAEREQYRRIVLSRSLLCDHKTDTLMANFQSLRETFHLVEPYSSVLDDDEAGAR